MTSWIRYAVMAAVPACTLSCMAAPEEPSCSGPIPAASIEPFRKGERVVCFGDSITYGGHYIWALQLFENLRHPGLDIRLDNFGWPGDTLSNAMRRWGWDGKTNRPDRVIMMFGMNDVGRELYGTNAASSAVLKQREARFEAYRTNLAEICRLIGRDVPRIDLMTPTPFDEYSRKSNVPDNPGCNELGLSRIADIVRRFAEENGKGLVENHIPMTRLLRRNPDSGIGGPDRVHPQWEGHYIVFANILQSLGERALVASVAVDAKAGTAECENACISNLKVGPGGISFAYLPKSLPFPYTPELKKVDPLVSFTEHFNQEPLRVSGLPQGSSWRLCADGRTLGVFTVDRLAKGVNLAELDTASARLAVGAAEAMKRMQAKTQHLRIVPFKDQAIRQMNVDPDDYDAACKALDRDLAIHNRNAWYKSTNERWKECKPRMREIGGECERLRDAMRAMPVPSVLTLEKVSESNQESCE